MSPDLVIAGLGLVAIGCGIAEYARRFWPEAQTVEEVPMDPEAGVAALFRALERSPGMTRAAVVVGGIRVSARFNTGIPIHPGGWAAPEWVVFIGDDFRERCPTTEVLAHVVLCRLRVLAFERYMERRATSDRNDVNS